MDQTPIKVSQTKLTLLDKDDVKGGYTHILDEIDSQRSSVNTT